MELYKEEWMSKCSFASFAAIIHLRCYFSLQGELLDTDPAFCPFLSSRTWKIVGTQEILFWIEVINWYIKVRYCDYCFWFSMVVNVGIKGGNIWVSFSQTKSLMFWKYTLCWSLLRGNQRPFWFSLGNVSTWVNGEGTPYHEVISQQTVDSLLNFYSSFRCHLRVTPLGPQDEVRAPIAQFQSILHFFFTTFITSITTFYLCHLL
jgi:hypothetical protein